CQPIGRAAHTRPTCHAATVLPRVTTAYVIRLTTPTAMYSLVRAGPTMLMTAITRIRNGKTQEDSTGRPAALSLRRASHLLRRRALNRPARVSGSPVRR